MTEIESAPRPVRRPGRRPLDTDRLRAARLDVDLNLSELEHCKQQAEAAALPLRKWARHVLTGAHVRAATRHELRALWSESSTLQSNANQLVERLNQLHRSGELRLAEADETLRGLAELAPRLYQLVCQMRLELVATGRGGR